MLSELINIAQKKAIKEYFDAVTLKIVSNANSKGKNLTNKIPESFEQEINDSGDVINAKLKAFRWIVQAWETGRGKRINTVKTNFEEALKRWIERKGIASGIKAQQKAKSLRYLINKRGTKGFPTRTGIISTVLSDVTLLQSLAPTIFKTVNNEIDNIIKDANINTTS